MDINNVLFDFDDLLILPAAITPIRSRKEVTVRYENGFLPLMTAPMDTVIDGYNYDLFEKAGIVPIMPRIQNPEKSWVRTDRFLAYSLEDFERIFLSEDKIITSKTYKIKALIDIANGHMEALYEITKKAKKLYGEDMILMVGNIANPDTYEKYCSTNVDFIRIGIGNGNGCLTTVQTGVGYPIASLIKECAKTKKRYGCPAIVADGGFKKYSDIIKGLGLGADYIMIGSMFNKTLESAGETTREDGRVIDQFSEDAKIMFGSDIPLFKTFRGMSTKEVQKEWGRDDLKTSEGIVRRNRVEYTIEGWVQNFESYLRSAMSYTGKKELSQFIGRVNFNAISQNSFKRFNK